MVVDTNDDGVSSFSFLRCPIILGVLYPFGNINSKEYKEALESIFFAYMMGKRTWNQFSGCHCWQYGCYCRV